MDKRMRLDPKYTLNVTDDQARAIAIAVGKLKGVQMEWPIGNGKGLAGEPLEEYIDRLVEYAEQKRNGTFKGFK